MSDYKPLRIQKFKKLKRRPIKVGRPPLPQAFLEMRGELASSLKKDIEELGRSLKPRTADEKRAIFLKVEHERPIDFTGTDLKKTFESGEKFSIVKVTDPEFPKLKKKIDDFGSGPLSKGHAKNENFFFNLIKIDDVNPYDRVSADLEEKMSGLANDAFLVYEVEIASDERGTKKQTKELATIKNKINDTIGPMSRILEHEDYYNSSRLLVRSQKENLIKLIEDNGLMGGIKWFDDTLKSQKPLVDIVREFNIENIKPVSSPTESMPTVCVIDSGVTTENPFIKPLVKDELVKSFITTNTNPYDEADHGTGVASLVAYHSLNIVDGAENNPVCWIASAKVLNADNELEEEKLFSKTLRSIVSEYKALGVRIFTLCVCFRDREWNESMRKKIKKTSWLARTIDNLSHEEDILFIIPTGNITISHLNHAMSGKIESFPGYYINDEFTILDPAQATYALTVGSITGSAIVTTGGTSQSISQSKYPSAFTRRGPGILGEVKPEVVEVGGGLIFDSSFSRVKPDPGLNVYVAKNSLSPALRHNFGTSFAAPRVAHKIAKIYSQLEESGISNPSMNLLKAFALSATDPLQMDEDSLKELTESDIRNEFLLGYGLINNHQATYCDKQQVLLYQEGSLPMDKILLVPLPIPAELAQVKGRKRLSITVVSSPEIQKSGLKKYHGSRIKWSLFKGNVSEESIIQLLSIDSDSEDESSSDTEDQEVGEVKSFKYGTRMRSKGCVQHDEYTWSVHKDGYSRNDYTIAITCQDIWGTKQKDVPYALVVRLDIENKTSVEIDVYNLIRTRVETRVRV